MSYNKCKRGIKQMIKNGVASLFSYAHVCHYDGHNDDLFVFRDCILTQDIGKHKELGKFL